MKEKVKSIKKKLSIIFIITGIILLFFPISINYITNLQMNYKINNFFETGQNLNTDEDSNLEKIYNLLKEQNQLLRDGKQQKFSESFEHYREYLYKKIEYKITNLSWNYKGKFIERSYTFN